jgi:hypothetical protein
MSVMLIGENKKIGTIQPNQLDRSYQTKVLVKGSSYVSFRGKT